MIIKYSELLRILSSESLQLAEGVQIEEGKQRACDSLIMCIVTSLNQGLRNGGGIGDVLRRPSSQVTMVFSWFLSDLLF